MNIVFEGWLHKIGGKKRLIKRWKKRYFVMYDQSIIYYFEDKSKAEQNVNLGVIMLQNATVEKFKGKYGKLNCFGITPSSLERTYFLVAKTPQIREKWLHVLCEKGGIKKLIGYNVGSNQVNDNANDNSNNDVNVDEGKQQKENNDSSTKDNDKIFPNSIIEGVMKKQGGNKKNWRTRYFVLLEGILQYYSNWEKKKMKFHGEIELNDAILNIEAADKYQFSITPYGGVRAYMIICSSNEQFVLWITTLKKHISTLEPINRQIRTPEPNKRKKKRSNTTYDAQPLYQPLSKKKVAGSVRQKRQVPKRSNTVAELEIQKQGYLRVKNKKTGGWQRRFFEICRHRTSLRCFGAKDQTDPTDEISLEGAEVKLLEKTSPEDPKYMFSICSIKDKVRFILAASTNKDAEEWVVGLQHEIDINLPRHLKKSFRIQNELLSYVKSYEKLDDLKYLGLRYMQNTISEETFLREYLKMFSQKEAVASFNSVLQLFHVNSKKKVALQMIWSAFIDWQSNEVKKIRYNAETREEKLKAYADEKTAEALLDGINDECNKNFNIIESKVEAWSADHDDSIIGMLTNLDEILPLLTEEDNPLVIPKGVDRPFFSAVKMAFTTALSLVDTLHADNDEEQILFSTVGRTITSAMDKYAKKKIELRMNFAG